MEETREEHAAREGPSPRYAGFYLGRLAASRYGDPVFASWFDDDREYSEDEAKEVFRRIEEAIWEDEDRLEADADADVPWWEHLDHWLDTGFDRLLEDMPKEVRWVPYEERANVRRRVRGWASAVADRLCEPVDIADSQRRYMAHWAIAQSPAIPGPDKVLMHAITLRVHADNSPSCSVGPRRLAHDASLSVATVYSRIKLYKDAGLLRGVGFPWSAKHREICVNIMPDAEMRSDLAKLWRSPPLLVTRHGVTPWWWTRALVRYDGTLVPFLPTAAKGVGLAASLLIHKFGWPRRHTSVAELCRLSGYSHRIVKEQLARLSEEGWIETETKRGRGGGTLVWLTYPDPLAKEKELSRSPWWLK